MRITAFNGSPRGAGGNTNRMLEPLLTGARAAGATAETIQLADLNIRHCTGCFGCWKTTPGTCVVQDDMAALLDTFISSDLVILASPLYTDSVSSILKKFLERLLPLLKPRFEFVDGETRHERRYERYPDFVVVSNCGYPEYSQFRVMDLLFQRLARELNVSVRAAIFRTMGELLKIENIMLRPVLKRYARKLAEAGEFLGRGEDIPQTLMDKINNPLIPEAMYRKLANEHWPGQ